MEKILFDQVPDLFQSVGDLFVEKRKSCVRWTPSWATATWA